MTEAPMPKKHSLSHLLPVRENSSTTTSLAAMYMKVPAAKELNTISIILFAVDIASPSPMPRGVASENKSNSSRALRLS